MGGDKRVEYWDSEQSRENSITYERATSLYHLLDSVAILYSFCYSICNVFYKRRVVLWYRR